MPRVTVVIPTFNRSALLRTTLGAVARLEAPAPDVVVVDDGSTPDELERVTAAVDACPGARLLRQQNAGPAAARNRGYRSGSADLVVFLDDDCAPERDWLTRLVEPFDRDAPPDAVGGRVVPAPPRNWVARFCAATEYSSGVQPVFENAATANACYRRAVLDDLEGFDEGFTLPGGDDPDLSARARAAGYRLEYVPEAIVYHAELESYVDFLRHMYGRGLGEARLARKHGRVGRVVARAVLAPVFLIRTGIGTWHRTIGKGGASRRSAWVILDATGRAAFLAGSIAGLLRST